MGKGGLMGAQWMTHDAVTATPSRHALEELSVDECLQLLSSQRVGRVAFVEDGAPTVLPVNYLLDEGSVLFRTDHGGMLDTLVRAAAAFEVDHVDVDERRGWSVVVQGRADEVWEPAELERVRRLPLQPFAPGERIHFVRLSPAAITGRRIR